MKKKGSLFPGLLLIAIGAILILRRIDYDFYYFSWDMIIPLVGVLLGLRFWITAFTFGNKGRVFPGTLLLVLGAFFLAWNSGYLLDYLYYDTFWPIFPTALGLSFLALVLVSPRNWLSIFPAIIFLGVGGISFAIYLDYLSYWELEDFWYEHEYMLDSAEDFFPLLIIIIGIIIIVSSLKISKRKKDTIHINGSGNQ